jgi:acetyl-CoA carboxylase carboxyltransferase component
MGYDVTKEALGGWHIHCCNGAVDNPAETEAEAMAMTRAFLSYLWSSVYEAPPVRASDPHADGCDKLRRHLDLYDVFHLLLLNLVDNPGFAVGIEHEVNATIRKGGEWMIAFAQVTMPIFTVIMRRSFGVAGNNYATPRAPFGTRRVAVRRRRRNTT